MLNSSFIMFYEPKCLFTLNCTVYVSLSRLPSNQMSFLSLPYFGLVVPCGLPPWSVGFSVPPPPPIYVCGLVCLYVSFIGKDMGVWLQSLSHCGSELTSQSSPPGPVPSRSFKKQSGPQKAPTAPAATPAHTTVGHHMLTKALSLFVLQTSPAFHCCQGPLTLWIVAHFLSASSWIRVQSILQHLPPWGNT